MALGFIKKVFTFGKEKPAETPAAPVELTSEEKAAISAESEPKGRDEDLPLAEDPVLAEEMETAGGPSDDLSPEDLSMVPLELLEAEAEEEAEDASVQQAAPAATEPEEEQVAAAVAETSAEPVVPVLPKGFATAEARAPEPEAPAPTEKLSWFQRLKAGLFRTSSQLTSQITALFTKRKLDDETLEELEDLLIQADLGVETALRVTDTLASERYGKDVTGEDVTKTMATEIVKVLKPVAKPLALDLSHKPHVILVVGVNGTGKTTTIGKLAAKLSGSGLKVMLAAGDTFRAAAIEQLKIWADRTGSTFIGTKLGADAAGLAYEAFERAKAEKSDVLIIDTAGRLQNKAELMAELEKIVRVLGKLDPDAPHTVLQTLDATTGQNALQQVEIFRNVAGVNGLIMTKLDGTARGGILVAIAAKHKLPVYFIGVGEGIDDLEPFEAEDFASAIAGIAR
ncbi:signal recognition particle-docking protein FtsY [Rhizobium sp. AQ_MP]|uniref:signal recognition particle-docking protein FtsY n=1 Tax=Rhizobium sp. AQ_MP TaxID=2761536 RepID=UPI00163AF9AC|nr:signal recognition particle-docking protein FtsY [Rhizobium sp. AQ_MP]MBC2772461.1 signal recognition particle-docking protein FtsY [Rhizobium sp. AQ_MP]